MQFGVDIPFVHHLGFELVAFDGGASELRYHAQPEHLNSYGVTHGGASMTFLDVVMASAARSVDKDLGVVTLEMKTSFMKAARGPLTGRGQLLSRTRKLAFVEGRIFDAAGDLCAHATGTFRYMPRADSAGQPAPLATD